MRSHYPYKNRFTNLFKWDVNNQMKSNCDKCHLVEMAFPGFN